MLHIYVGEALQSLSDLFSLVDLRGFRNRFQEEITLHLPFLSRKPDFSGPTVTKPHQSSLGEC